MPDRNPTRLACLYGCAVVLCFLAGQGSRPARADVVTMADGRRFEGAIVEQGDAAIRLDAMVSGIRTQLTLPRSQIAEIVERALPEGFYESDDAIAGSVDESAAVAVDQAEYLVVPITGTFGEQVVAAGVRQSLAYAVRQGIGNVVFEVDSDGGNVDVAEEIYELLERYDERLSYHTIVRRCLRGALIFPVWSDTVQVQPGAVIGGGDEFDIEDLPGIDRVMLSQIAYDLGRVAEAHGKPAVLVQAMIDPKVELAAWRDATGGVVLGARLPESVADEDVIFVDDDRTVVTLTTEDALALGLVAAYTGDADDLGEWLGIDGWTKESDYGPDAMRQAVQRQAANTANIAARAEAQIKQNIKRRELVQRSIDTNLERAAQWDPRGGSYATMQSSGGGSTRVGYRRYYYSGTTNTNRLTKQSRQVWQERTDLTLDALRQARKSILEMKKLDGQAVELGLEPNYDEGELKQLQKDTEVAITMLVSNRNRKTN